MVDPTFTAVPGQTGLGVLQLPFEAHLVINDGQHRRAAIEEALQGESDHWAEEYFGRVIPVEHRSRRGQE